VNWMGSSAVRLRTRAESPRMFAATGALKLPRNAGKLGRQGVKHRPVRCAVWHVRAPRRQQPQQSLCRAAWTPFSKGIPSCRPSTTHLVRGARHKSGIAGVMWGRLAACAAVGYRRSVVQARAVGRLTIGCSLPSCPTLILPQPRVHLRSDSSRFLMNPFGLHFYVAHPQRLSCLREPRHRAYSRRVSKASPAAGSALEEACSSPASCRPAIARVSSLSP